MKAVISSLDYATELLDHIVERYSPHTTLIICSTRNEFFDQISPVILAPLPQEIPASQESVDDDEPPTEPVAHPFLTPTLDLLAMSKTVKLAFCPSIDAVRAYLSSYVAPARRASSTHPLQSPTTLLVILDLVLLHHSTSEFSVQGLSRSFACAVEAASRNKMDLLLSECKAVNDPRNPSRGSNIWNAEVPLLSGSVRIGGEGTSFAGRMIRVRIIAGRWFDFEQKEQNEQQLKDAVENEDEEMLV